MSSVSGASNDENRALKSQESTHSITTKYPRESPNFGRHFKQLIASWRPRNEFSRSSHHRCYTQGGGWTRVFR